jgi:hypothetical protein
MYPRHILPGIGVEVPPPVAPDALPRMDVALFVGFAARGPVHRPIMIESVATYQAVFGGEVVLARDEARGRDVTAALAPAVRGFFSNGGTRCWVIRTCRTAAVEARWRGTPSNADCASARTFTLPLFGRVQAASLGSWADGCRVSVRAERTAAYPRFMLRAELGDLVVTGGPFGAAPGDPDSWWSLAGDDAFYAHETVVAQVRSLVAPLGIPGPIDLSLLSDFWSAPVGPDADPRTSLERDGLSRFDAELFLDPDLVGLTLASLGDNARRIRDLEGRTLAGLHGAFAVPGGADFGEPSLIAVPDAAQCGWDRRPDTGFPEAHSIAGETPATWRDHAGSCAVPPVDPAATAPDASRFLDCSTRLLATPEFSEPVQVPERIDLSWSASETGATYILEEAARADFSGATEIWRGAELTHGVAASRDGVYYYRIHAEFDGNISGASVVGVPVRSTSWLARDATNFESGTILTVHQALLCTAAAIGDQFALLSLPRHYRTPEAAGHAPALAASLLDNEVRALSFAALYHPWIASPTGSATTPDLIETPPDGAVAGTFAGRSRQRGPWVAPASIAMRDIVALTPIIPDADRTVLTLARINTVRRAPTGFVASDSFSLSPEADWQQLNVRRLMSLIRRVAIRRGAPFVFEPNGDVLRRAVERIFGHMLDDLVRRGAFAGKGPGDSYRLAVSDGANDRMNGRLIIEIAVRPSLPMRFLTLVFAQAGERFTVAEER